MDQEAIEALANIANGTIVAIALLAKALDGAGAMSVAQYAEALGATLNQPGADSERSDYLILSGVLSLLQNPDAGSAPIKSFQAIKGGKS